MSNSGYFKGYRDLINHPSVLSAPHTYRWVLIMILDRMAYEPCVFDDHGKNISIIPGQLFCTYEQLASWAGVDGNIAKRSVVKFELAGILTRKVNREIKKNGRQDKTLLTISWNDNQFYKDYLKSLSSDPKRDPKSEPKANRKQELIIQEHVCLSLEEKKVEEEMDDSPLIVAKSKKHASGVTSIRLNALTQQLLDEKFTQEEINQAIGILKNSDAILNSPIKNYLIGVMKKQRLTQINPKKDSLEWKNNKTKEKLTQNSTKSSRTDNVFYSEKDIQESPLAIYARLNGLK